MKSETIIYILDFYILNKYIIALVFKNCKFVLLLFRLSAGVTADRPDTAKARETARQRMANLLKPKSTFENDLFQNFAKVVKCLEHTELVDIKDFEIINRGAFYRVIL